VLETWDHWALRSEIGAARRSALPLGIALATLERIVAGMNDGCAADARLPWQEGPR